MKLVVKLPFANYQVGDEITDADKVAAIVASEHQHNVLKVSVTAADLAAAAKQPKTK
jgi:hypothetical protein